MSAADAPADAPAPRPEAALRALAAELAAERAVLSGHVTDPAAGARPTLGVLAAAGPRTAAARGEYAVVVEAVREGYLLHHGEARLIDGADRDLALLAGDYLYALGIERLAALGDVDAVRELADLISLAAQLHAQERAADLASALWLAGAVAIGCGASERHLAAKEAVREGRDGALDALAEAARDRARDAGIGELLSEAADAIDSGARSG